MKKASTGAAARPSVRALFGTTKPVIGMAHLLPLPGSPLYDRKAGIDAVAEAVARDVRALQAGGVDGIMFGNEGDRPYVLSAPPEALAAMAAVVARVAPETTVPFGVDFLWDPVATVALAVATGARFAREVFTGVYDSDMGLWQPAGAAALRRRVELGRDDLVLFFNVNAEFAAPMGDRTVAAKARSAVFSSLADVVCVSGPMTGEAAEVAAFAAVKQAVGATPVFANTGVNRDNVAAILRHGDGVVVGTHLKKDGITWNPVDRARVARFMDAVRKAR
ncbi:MAG: BtpA/SgcQ family protein [Alphaproteobacteria bacterium]